MRKRSGVNTRFGLYIVLLCGSAISITGAGCSRESSAQAASPETPRSASPATPRVAFTSPNPDTSTDTGTLRDAEGSTPRKLGVLLVSHGSRSLRWREMLLGVEKGVRKDLMALDDVELVTSAFMEYTEPSIATRLEEFDQQGFTDIILVPLLLTVSGHSFDDIPTICGEGHNVVATERLRADGIRIYKPKANLHTTELLDFADILGKNVLRRVQALSENAPDEGVLLIGYGSADYDVEWTKLLDDRLGSLLKQELGVPESRHCWCGHIAHYDPVITQRAIEDILTRRKRALVVPVLVAIDEMFQEGIIQEGIDKVGDDSRIRYVPDAILPDPGLRAWVVEATAKVHRDVMGRVN